MPLTIEVLSKKHSRTSFSCGDEALDNYLLKVARQHIDKGISRTFVLVDSAMPAEILGYMTITVCEVASTEIPQNLAKKYPSIIPAAKLARLAISAKIQQQGYGQLMLIDAMKKTVSAAQNIGIAGLFVDAKHEAAKQYYEQFGFLSLPEQLDNLFLPIATIGKLLNE